MLRTDVRRGDFYAPCGMTFVEFADEWIESYEGRTSGGIRDSSRERYRRALARYAKPFFGSMRLTDVQPRHVKRYAASLAPLGLSYNSVRLAVAPVRALLATAAEDGLIRANPASGIRIPRPAIQPDDHAPSKILSPQELERLLKVTPNRWRLFVRFLAETGLRIGELLALEWRDVDLDNHQMHVRRTVTEHDRLAPPKTRHGRRTIPISTATAHELRRRRLAAGTDQSPVFANRVGGRLIASNVAARVFKPAARTAGVPSASFHTLRHTCGSNLFRAGANVKQVQVFLGHSTRSSRSTPTFIFYPPIISIATSWTPWPRERQPDLALVEIHQTDSAPVW